MAAVDLESVPDHLKTPNTLELKPSGIVLDSLGVYSVSPIPEGTEFGPYVGKVVPPEAAKGIDRRYSWEVYNLDSMTLTHIVDATDSKDGNWMRFVNAARFFEEQNIVSTQRGQQVFYKALKNIEPGEELLTWYRKKRGRKRKSTTDSFEPAIKEPPDDADNIKPKRINSPKLKKANQNGDSPKRRKPSLEMPVPAINTDKPKRIRKPKIIPDAYEGSFLVPKKSKPANDDLFEPLKPGQLRRRRKKNVKTESAEKIPTESAVEKESVETPDDEKAQEKLFDSENLGTASDNKAPGLVESENNISMYEETINEVAKGKRRRKKSKDKTANERKALTNEDDEKSPSKDQTASQPASATSQLIEINNSVDWVYPEKGQEYVFKLEKHMITQGPNGCVYTCDICTGIYKNKFSLKRHYLRNHINYRYLSKADIINCLINLQQVLESENDNGMIVKTENDEIQNNKNDFPEPINNHEKLMNKVDNNETINGQTDSDLVDSTHDKICEESIANDLSEKNYNTLENGHSRNIELLTEKEEISGKENCKNNHSEKEIVGHINRQTDDPTLEIERNSERKMADRTSSEPLKTDSRMKEIWMKMECQGIYRCYTCRQIFNTLQEIKYHTALGHPEEINTKMQYSCDKCNMRFYFKQNLFRHSASHNRNTAVTVKQEASTALKKEPESSDSPPLLTDDGIPRNHQCAVCHQRFDSLILLFKHQEKHKNDFAKKRCPCQYCGKDFLSITNMKKHVRFHLGYRITCRNCSEVFSNVGALRKHTRLSHPEIYNTKQLNRITHHSAALKDQKSVDPQEESCDSQLSDKVKKVGKGLRRKSSQDKLGEFGSGIDNKENSETKQEEYHFVHGLSFAVDEIDDGGSRFKFSCTVCKKRFSNYVNMCRHRRKAHGNETKPKPEPPKPLPAARLNTKKPKPLYSEPPEEVALFYASVSHNIATNLNEYIDGKAESLQNFRDHIKVEDYTPVATETDAYNKAVDLTWEMYNFPPNYKPRKTVSFTEIRQEFDIHSEFENHFKSFESQSDTVSTVVKETKEGKAQIRIQGGKILSTSNLEETSNCSGSEDQKRRDKFNSAEKSFSGKIDTKATEESKADNRTSDFKLTASSCESDSSKMDLMDGKVLSILRKKVGNSQRDFSSPCSLEFKHIENGEYANFDDLLIGDIDSPIIPRSKSVSGDISHKKQDLLKTSLINKSENMLDIVTNTKHESNTIIRSEDKSDIGPAFSPKPLSLMCENLLGLKPKETSHASQNLSIESSSVSSLDSHSTGNQSGYNGSWLTKLSLAVSQKEGRFQSTNQEVRDIKADYAEAQNHTMNNYHEIAFGKNGQVACVCAICKKHFHDFECLLRHHWKKHPGSICQFIEVEQGNEIDALHFSEPSTVGALAVTDPGLDNVTEREIFTCTGCGALFKTLAKLHIHIVSCTPIYSAKDIIKEENGSKTPIKKKIQNKVKSILNGGNSYKYKIQELSASQKNEKVKEESNTQNNGEPKAQNKGFSGFSGFKKILPKPPGMQMQEFEFKEKSQVPAIKLPRRKSQELMGYNPQNHVRRRELTELVDSHQCEACGSKFKTIILLERHVPNCSMKEKFKDLCPMKCPVMDKSLEKLKHVCHYCQKHFTYLKSLVNHLQDFCAVKKQKVDCNAITEEDREKESEVITKFKKLEEEKLGAVKVVENGARKKGWQKGMKRKPKKKGHSWTLIKKKKPDTSDQNVIETTETTNDDDELVDKSFSDNESEYVNEDHDVISEKEKNQEMVQNKISASMPYKQPPVITISPLDDPEIMKSETNCLELPLEAEVDSIDEVDSGHDIFINDIAKNREDRSNNIVTHPSSSIFEIRGKTKNLITTDVPIILEGVVIKEHLSKEYFKQENKESIHDDEDIIGKMEQHENNKDMIIMNVPEPKNAGSVNVVSAELVNTQDLEPIQRERSRSIIFQCIGSQDQLSENNQFANPDEPSSVTKTFDNTWKRFRKSMKKKLLRSKGNYELNKEMKEDNTSKFKQNISLVRKNKPKNLETLFQENIEKIKKEDEPADEALSTDEEKEVEKENLQISKESMLNNDHSVDMHSVCFMNMGKESSNFETVKEDDNVSVDLTDEIQIFEIAASGNICFNVHNVGTENPSVSIKQKNVSDKKTSEADLKSAKSSTLSGPKNRIQELKAGANKRCNEKDLQAKEIKKDENVSVDTGYQGNIQQKKENESIQTDKHIDNSGNDDGSCLDSEIVLNEVDKTQVSDIKNSVVKIKGVSGNCDVPVVLSANDFPVIAPNDLNRNQRYSIQKCTNVEHGVDNLVGCINTIPAIKQDKTGSANDVPSSIQESTPTNSFVTENDLKVDHSCESAEFVDVRKMAEKFNENDIKNDKNFNEEATVFEPVFESVSEKVKKRKRNASSRQLQTIVGNECTGVLKRKHVKNTDKSDKHKDNEKSETSNSGRMIGTRKNKIQELNVKISPKNNSGSIKKAVSKDNISAKESSKEHRLSNNKTKKSTSPKDKRFKSTSPVKNDKPLEIMLSPSERVKLNKRQCRKEVYSDGLSHTKTIERSDKDSVFKRPNSEIDNNSAEYESQGSNQPTDERKPYVSEFLDKIQSSEKTVNVTECVTMKEELKSDEKRTQKSKSQSKLPRKISKESLATGAKLADYQMKFGDYQKDTTLKRKRGKMKTGVNLEEVQTYPASKIPKFEIKIKDKMTISEAVIVKRQSKMKATNDKESTKG